MSGKNRKPATPAPTANGYLRSALVKSHAVRATVFHRGVQAAKLRSLFAAVDAVKDSECDWSDPKSLHVRAPCLKAVQAKGISLHQVFAHPAVLEGNPRLVGYYRNLVAVSQKGMAQLGLPTARFERKDPGTMDPSTALLLCQTFNSVICSVLEGLPSFDLESGRDVAFAEVGTEIQGTWANAIGLGAAKAVEDMFAAYIAKERRGSRVAKGHFNLCNGWEIVFGAEPDVRFLDTGGIERIAIEIKGSLDRAGAQTRYGEAKKSFAKSLRKNPRCHTIYLASCFTESVLDQVRADGQVRDVVNLTSVLYDAGERDRFLKRVFHIVDTPL